jgi:LacI family transcriptional regulator
VEPRYVAYGGHDREVARVLASALLAQRPPPTAVFACSDVQARGVIAAAHEAGLGVPEDLSVVGFDDIELSAYLGITTVHQPLFASGRLGAELLLAELRGNRPPSTTHELELELVERGTAAAPGGRRGCGRPLGATVRSARGMGGHG